MARRQGEKTCSHDQDSSLIVKEIFVRSDLCKYVEFGGKHNFYKGPHHCNEFQ